MLESAEIGHRIAKQAYDRAEPRLREALLNAQFDLAQSQRGPLLLIISGVDGGGRGETANQLTAWMDPRHIRVVAFGPPTPEESAHPAAWRFWRALPAKGRVGIFMNAWYSETLDAGMHGEIDDDELRALTAGIRQHESMLAHEGLVLLKFWIHLSKADQKERLEQLGHDPRTSWRVTRADWTRYRRYTKAHDLWERVLRGRRLAQPKKMEGLRGRHLRHRRSNEHRDRALDIGRGRGQTVRSCESIEDRRQTARGRT